MRQFVCDYRQKIDSFTRGTVCSGQHAVLYGRSEFLIVLRRWIEGGADYEPHWAFVAPERTTPPQFESESVDWIRTTTA